eukprot:GFUD01038772.1.p1 GENE.GFUD01038772.1~~GFUD01038772.1.p1  ORF type:complete len:158 (+),score=33.88 GFUD01038772.1:49-522(+)
MDTPTTTTKDLVMTDVNLQPPPCPPPPSQSLSNTDFICEYVNIEWGKYGEGQGSRSQVCSSCDSTVWTTVTTSITGLGFLWFLLCYCCCCVCALLPFHLNTFKKFKHFCPNCGALLKTISPKLTPTNLVFAIISIIFYFIMILLFLYVVAKYLGVVR